MPTFVDSDGDKYRIKVVSRYEISAVARRDYTFEFLEPLKYVGYIEGRRCDWRDGTEVYFLSDRRIMEESRFQECLNSADPSFDGSIVDSFDIGYSARSYEGEVPLDVRSQVWDDVYTDIMDCSGARFKDRIRHIRWTPPESLRVVRISIPEGTTPPCNSVILEVK
jgi:hypothetical protein